MEIRVLKYFLAIARAESISAAAEFLHVTQPTLSRQIMELEKELGTKLFVRGSRRITLTDEGLRLRKRAEDIVDMVDKTEAEFFAPGDDVEGDIYIGGGETHAMRYMAEVIKVLREEYPRIRFHLHSGNAEDVTDRLDKGLLDFGLLIEADLSKYDSVRLPAKDTWGVLARKDSPLAGKEVIRTEDLWDAPLICSRQRSAREDVSRWLQREAKDLNIVATYNLIYNASLLVEAGVGYALCLDKLVNTTGTSRLRFIPLNPQMDAGIDVVWKKYQVFSKAGGLFLKKLKDMIEG